VAATILRRHGYHVLDTANGIEAVTASEHHVGS